MSTYKFTLANYHAVKEATITLDGVTVLSGLNGSGKSSIARWLHHTVKVLNDFDRMIDDEGIEKLLRLFDNIKPFVRGLNNYDKYRQLDAITEELKSENISSFDTIHNYFLQVLAVVNEALAEAGNIEGASLQRYRHFFGLSDEESEDAENFTAAVLAKLTETYHKIEQECDKKKQSRSMKDFEDEVFSFPNYDSEETKMTLEFKEDDVDMITTETFNIPLNLRNVVYINTQFIGQSLMPNDTGELSEMLSTQRCEISPKAQALVKYLQVIIGGDVAITKKKKAEAFRRKPLTHYTLVRNNGTSFDLRGAATGEISFSYLLQLIKNGWIDDGTLFIIDEPESHLHPQWIVDCARTLVLLHKSLGAKVLISSHNPDMISAIQSIAEVEDVLDKTNFYLAEEAPEGDGQYIFTHQGCSIEKIFDTFNIAIDRINDYGQR